jgi:hypothetical protein
MKREPRSETGQRLSYDRAHHTSLCAKRLGWEVDCTCGLLAAILRIEDEMTGWGVLSACDPPTTHRYRRVGSSNVLRCVRCWYERREIVLGILPDPTTDENR